VVVNIKPDKVFHWVYLQVGHAPLAVGPSGAINVSDWTHLFAILNKVPLATRMAKISRQSSQYGYVRGPFCK